VRPSLGEAARRALEALMSTGGDQYLSDFARKYHAQGEASGEARGKVKGEAMSKSDAIVTVLRARGLVVTAAVEERIRGCTDLAELDERIARAAVVSSPEEVFDYRYQSEFARKYVAQGEAQGRAKAIVSVLKARGLAVPAAVEERVRACTDLAKLDECIARTVVVPSADEIFG
jgi:predicted ArsR family transcriptional regulator